MAQSNFDFKDFSSKKVTDYLKQFCKAKDVRKAKVGILLIDYKLGGKKTPCVFIPLRKKPEAISIFKQIKADKEHLMKKTGLATVFVSKGEDGKEEISIKIRKGGLSPEVLKAKGSNLFESVLKMKLNIEGMETTSEKPGDTEEKSADTSSEQTTAPHVKAIAKSAQKAFVKFKNEFLPAIKNKNLSAEQREELKTLFKDFDAFNQMAAEIGVAAEKKFGKLIQPIHKAALIIANLPAVKSDIKADIINDDNEFSAEEKAAIQQLVKDIKEGFALVKSEVMPNIKNNEINTKDRKTLGKLVDNIDRFEDNYEAAPQVVKDKMAKFKDNVSSKKTKVQEMINKLDAKGQKIVNKMLTPEQRKEIMQSAKVEIENVLKELEELKALSA